MPKVKAQAARKEILAVRRAVTPPMASVDQTQAARQHKQAFGLHVSRRSDGQMAAAISASSLATREEFVKSSLKVKPDRCSRS